ncbi:hypothetical protein K493DRAFT_315311 [Basidiobolus meristosporus CBS 931.73]|uniref:CBM1 domain-containing protein n=1 Tax=Basidiobolus meristosporus CBS 931.73 TaxID=1314790 RepID=A0A1Y1Y9Y2_9FUNG|nr:hypothetical protein K493DRAFT_315311 [Basidiobolus meristosporus CBS 931.73]|eukprot:ORX94830.1 hypothetical protein K493DRAFT_315311 [Basidiobolus meristosporus CBS 931.73]
MRLPNAIATIVLATSVVVFAVPSVPCNQSSGVSYFCEGQSFYQCQTSTGTWLLQNICAGDCCDLPAYAAFCPNCKNQTTTKTTTTTSNTTKPTVSETISTTTTSAKPTTTKSTTSKPSTTTTTKTNQPDPTVAPGAPCLVNGRYGCKGSYFLVCQNGQWAVQNGCGGTCCDMFQYAQYCYNC